MKELLKTTKQPKLVVFEGVRNDESAKRSAYNRVGEGVKHVNLINCRPIIKWNATETYLYMYKNGVEINPAYTLGLTRVGCGVCPFASDWSEYVIRKRYPQIAKDYISVVEDMARNIGITSKSKIDEYVSSGNWKKNAGYLTAEHLRAIDEHGMCKYHRPSFLKKHMEKQLCLI